MTALILALVSAAGYGVSDFVAGVSSRHRSGWSVAVAGQAVSGLALLFMAIGRLGDPTSLDLAWGAAAGIGNAVGTVFLYRGLGSGRMSVVAPVSAVGAAVLPVGVGLLLGERPSAVVWGGILAALPGIWLVSRVVDHPVEPVEPVESVESVESVQSVQPRPAVTGQKAALATPLRDGVLAGLGFGVVFACLGQVPESAGIQPLLLNQAVAMVAIVALAAMSGQVWRPRGVAIWGGGVAGAISGVATLCYLLSTHAGALTVVAVLTSLYPAVTILLAAGVLRERIHPWQGVGLLLCGVAVALVGGG